MAIFRSANQCIGIGTVVRHASQVVEVATHVHQRHFGQFHLQGGIGFVISQHVGLVSVSASVFEVDTCHGAFHPDIAFVVYLFLFRALAVRAGEVEGGVLLGMFFPMLHFSGYVLFDACSVCGRHQESMLMVFSSPHGFSSYYVAIGVFSDVFGFVYPFFQHEVLLEEVS